MAGVWFVVSVPTKTYEKELQKTLKRTSTLSSDTEHQKKKGSDDALSLHSNSTADSGCQTKIREEQEASTSEEETKTFQLAPPPKRRRGSKSNVNLPDSNGSSEIRTVEDQQKGEEKPQQPDPSVANTTFTIADTKPAPLAQPEDVIDLSDFSLEEILEKILKEYKIDNAVWTEGRSNHFYQVVFPTPSGEACESLLQELTLCGVGTKLSSVVSVVPSILFYSSCDETDCQDDIEEEAVVEERKELSAQKQASTWTRFVASITSRLTVAQVVEGVRGNAELTFDFIILLLVASLVAALGLLENSSVVLVASMLISPLMGPILAGTFGTVIHDRKLQIMGVRNELFGLLFCLVVGFLFGLATGPAVQSWGGGGTFPTVEMEARGRLRSLWVGVLIALPSGVGVALSVLGGNAGSLVGVAISASLLPPAVNCGIMWAWSLVSLSGISDMVKLSKLDYASTVHGELACLGAVSLCLTLLNIACIFTAGVLVLKLKEVAPHASGAATRRFWKQDIKIARDYNKTMTGNEAKELGKRFLQEMGNTSEDGEELFQDALQTAVEEAQEDNVLRNVRHLQAYKPPPDVIPSPHLTWSHPNLVEPRPSVLDLESNYATVASQHKMTRRPSYHPGPPTAPASSGFGAPAWPSMRARQNSWKASASFHGPHYRERRSPINLSAIQEITTSMQSPTRGLLESFQKSPPQRPQRVFPFGHSPLRPRFTVRRVDESNTRTSTMKMRRTSGDTKPTRNGDENSA